MVSMLVNVHDRAVCAGHPCCVHNPTNHHMYGWRQHWRSDRALMERLCRHGVGHPDPDHLDYVRRSRGGDAAWAESVHGCDGCCARPGTGDLGR
jgi:hypothetical protein